MERSSQQQLGETAQTRDWNVLTSRWLEVINLDAEARVSSPLEVLDQAREIRCIAAASPLDMFAAQRFLLALVYWKAGATGDVRSVRESMLRGTLPPGILDAIKAESPRFCLFDAKDPFLQDPSAPRTAVKSAGSLFAEFACGTNIAHFHHGDDDRMRLCVRCATIGMMRLVPWSQAGGAGLTPSIHNAPPVVAVPSDRNLLVTLGRNLVPLATRAGHAKWSGHFAPTDKEAPIPYLEAFTWNPRRVLLLRSENADVCWRCGRTGIATVGPIVFLKNEQTKKRVDKEPFQWQDPSAFYGTDAPYSTLKSCSEARAVTGRDLDFLLDEQSAPNAVVVAENAEHANWRLIVPCTNPANNKTFDHREIVLRSLSPDAVRASMSTEVQGREHRGFDGWSAPRRPARIGGFARFVGAAARLLTSADWAALSVAAYRRMDESPAAFDVLSGLLWPLRAKADGLPSRNVAWLVLKLMAFTPPRFRVPHMGGFSPLASLRKRQPDERRRDGTVPSRYPVALPRGRRLEAGLRTALDTHIHGRAPARIDWGVLCHTLDQLLD